MVEHVIGLCKDKAFKVEGACMRRMLGQCCFLKNLKRPKLKKLQWDPYNNRPRL